MPESYSEVPFGVERLRIQAEVTEALQARGLIAAITAEMDDIGETGDALTNAERDHRLRLQQQRIVAEHRLINALQRIDNAAQIDTPF